MKPPPEERLLRLIRGRRPQPASPAASAPPTSGIRAGGLFPRPKPIDGLRWLAAGLGVLLVAEIAWVVVQTARPLPTFDHSPPAAPASADEADRAVASLDELPSLAANAPSGLFAAPVAAVTPAATAERLQPKAGMSGSAKQLASRLTLMGIVAGEQPQAIIEDAETKKTYFVTAGQVVADGAVLEQVLDNRVILDFEGEKIELTL
jgi:type II secretory pathway component PulC